MSDDLPESAIRKLLSDALDDDDPTHEMGRYRLIRELGRGAMGVVWEAEDQELQRRVALKILSTPLLSDEDARRRFVREAQAAAKLSHPGVAAVYDATDRMLAMQLVDGVPLSRYPRQDVRQLVRFMRDAALAVQHAHERGVIHRDIKPSNLLIEGDRILVADFGLAKETALESSISVSGAILGTPAYMAPEQAEGRLADVDPRTDVYGLGATLYDLLAGRPPFVERDVYRLLKLVVEATPPPMRASRDTIPRDFEVPRDLEVIVQRCLAKERERRYQSAQELAADLSRWLEGEPVLARPPSLRYRATKFVLKRRAVVIASALGLLTTAITSAIVLSYQHAQRKTSEEVFEVVRYVDVRMDDAGLSMARDTTEAAARRDEAIAKCRDFLNDHPDSAYIQYLLGRLLRAKFQGEEARDALNRALEEQPTLLEARLERGVLGAIEFLEQRTKLEDPVPSPADVSQLPETLVLLRAQALADLEVLDSGEADSWRHVDVSFGKALRSRLQGDNKATRNHLDKVFELNPRHFDATLVDSNLLLDEGSADAAWYSAMRAVDVMQGFGSAYDSNESPQPEAPSESESSVPVPNDWSEVLFARENTNSRTAKAYATQVWVHLGKVRPPPSEQDLETLELARVSLTGIINVTPTACALSNRGACHWEKSRRLESLGRAEESRRERDEAARDFQAALQQDPNSPWAHYNQAIWSRESPEPTSEQNPAERLRQAVHHFGVYLGRFPGDTRAHRERGKAWLALAEALGSDDPSRWEGYQEAWADFDLAYRMGDQSAEDLGLRGICRGGLGDSEGALSDLKLSLDQDDLSPDVRLRFEEARQHLTR